MSKIANDLRETAQILKLTRAGVHAQRVLEAADYIEELEKRVGELTRERLQSEKATVGQVPLEDSATKLAPRTMFSPPLGQHHASEETSDDAE